MPLSKDLFLAILSMDAYNRGYGARLEDPATAGRGLGISDQTTTYKIGNAKVLFDADDSDGEARNAGFYALSYEMQAPDAGSGEQGIARAS